MTSPDGKVPGGAFSGSAGGGSLSDLAKANQSAMKSAVAGDIVKSYSGISVNLGSAIDAGVKRFAADLCDAVTGATGGLIDLGGWARQLRSEADQALRDSVQAQQTAQGTQSTAANQTTIIKATNSRVQVVIDGLPVKPYWETMNLTEESSFPRNLLQRAAWELSAASGSVTSRYVPSYTPAANTLEATFIRCLYSGGRKMVSYVPDAVSSPCELYVVVGRMLDNGDVKIEWVSPNQTPEITATRVERSVELPAEVMFELGETAFVGIHQRGSGNRRPLLGIEAVEIPRPATVWPPQVNAQFATSSMLSAGVTLAAGTLSFTSQKTPYLALGKASISGDPIKLMFFEDFESGMPTAMARMSARYATTANGVFQADGLDDGLRRYIYGQKLNYDNQMVSGRIREPTSVAGRLLLRSDANNSSYMSLSVTTSAISIVRWTGGVNSTIIASLQTSVADNDELRIKAVGNVYTAERKIAGEWVAVLTHTDTANTLPSGPAYRYTGLGTDRQSWTDGGGWGDWQAEDL
ncbi:hypothetical protein [Nocardia asteroides]|uniref:hypothetical protein n=1 Tax=Nocardia asteroides TaxID=1824 RepID=UPI00342D8D6C